MKGADRKRLELAQVPQFARLRKKSFPRAAYLWRRASPTQRSPQCHLVKNALLPHHGLQRFCWVFLRRHRKTIDDICYDYWSLCESVRTAAGPRQRIVATLGKLSDDETRPEAGWDEMRHLLEGRPAAKQMRLAEKLPAGASPPHTRRWGVADVVALRVERVRDFGEARFWRGVVGAGAVASARSAQAAR